MSSKIGHFAKFRGVRPFAGGDSNPKAKKTLTNPKIQIAGDPALYGGSLPGFTCGLPEGED